MKCRVAEQSSIAAGVLFVLLLIAMLGLQPFAEAPAHDGARLDDGTRAVVEHPGAVFQWASYNLPRLQDTAQGGEDPESSNAEAPI